MGRERGGRKGKGCGRVRTCTGEEEEEEVLSSWERELRIHRWKEEEGKEELRKEGKRSREGLGSDA